MQTDLVAVAGTVLGRYGAFAGRWMSVKYEQTAQGIPLLRLRDYAVAMHAEAQALGVSVNVHHDSFSLETLTERLEKRYKELANLSISGFAASEPGYGITIQEEYLLCALFQPQKPYVTRQPQPGKAMVIRMDVMITKKAMHVLKTDEASFAALVYGYILRTFIAEHILYVRTLAA